MAHPLDNPVWAALTSAHAGLSEGGPQAKRIRADVGPFAAAADASPAAIAALAALVPADEEISLLQYAAPEPPAGIVCVMRKACVQMTAERLNSAGAACEMLALGEADAAEMLALAALTRPGPFRARTHTLGRFLGVRDGARLAAMAGERMRTDGFIEISAVCTHPDYRGRGYAGALMRAVGARILADGATPFLHSYADNAGAIALYRSLGFEVRSEITHAIWARA